MVFPSEAFLPAGPFLHGIRLVLERILLDDLELVELRRLLLHCRQPLVELEDGTLVVVRESDQMGCQRDLVVQDVQDGRLAEGSEQSQAALRHSCYGKPVDHTEDFPF